MLTYIGIMTVFVYDLPTYLSGFFEKIHSWTHKLDKKFVLMITIQT